MGAAAMLAAAPRRPRAGPVPQPADHAGLALPGRRHDGNLARLIIDDVAAILGQPIVVEQKLSAAGTIGARFVATSKGDGYTLLANTSQHVMYEGMFKNLPFRPMEDFRPVGVLGSAPIIVVTGENSPYKTFKDVLEAARTRNLTFASGAQGLAAPPDRRAGRRKRAS